MVFACIFSIIPFLFSIPFSSFFYFMILLYFCFFLHLLHLSFIMCTFIFIIVLISSLFFPLLFSFSSFPYPFPSSSPICLPYLSTPLLSLSLKYVRNQIEQTQLFYIIDMNKLVNTILLTIKRQHQK